jgi:hypothetical protein
MREVKMRYYELAKETHPDVLAQKAREAAAAEEANVQAKVASFETGVLETDHMAGANRVVPFLEVQAAYDALMEDAGGAEEKRAARRSAGGRSRERTLGEVLCDRLRDEPEVYAELWEEILRDKLKVNDAMLDALFRAARRSAKQTGAHLDAARSGQRIILDGTAQGVLTIDSRCSAFVTLLTWCQAEEEALGDFALEVIEQINDEDRAHSPAVMAAIGAVFCSGTRSPY